MAKVLVVDDEQRYRELMTRILSGEDHATRVAASGREALDVGTRYRPDVLVTDWMLKDDIHGLHVVNVLRSVLPETRAIMMTGFASEDLRKGADKAGVRAFLEKPFGADQILAAVRQVTAPGEAPPEPLSPKLAMMEIDAAGTIVFANLAARDMMDETEAGRNADNLAALLADEAGRVLDAAMDRWVAVLPRVDGRRRWHLRSQEPLDGGSRLVVLRRWDEPQHLGLALVEMLLGATDIEHARWPLDGRVLVVDDEAWLRSLFVSMLERAGAGCYAAGTPEDALRLLGQDDGLLFVLLDFEMPGIDTASLIKRIRAARPNATIVGNSGGDRRNEFASLGVDRYLEKPWRMDDLINLLMGRIGNCASCSLPLPLRHPKPDEVATSWVCGYCGARYQGVLDGDCPESIQSNVRPAGSA